MTVEDFTKLISRVSADIDGRALDGALRDYLTQTVGPDSALFGAIEKACHEAIDEGWMCSREAGGIAFGRVVKQSPEVHGFSVDVVRMTDLKGPHHSHPNGEIDMIMPLSQGAEFDGHGKGWCVYEPGSAHYPTVTGGEALVLYLLPGGAIEFTRK